MRRSGTTAPSRASEADYITITSHVRAETWTFLRRRAGHRVATTFLDSLERSPRVETLHVTPAAEEEALRWLRRRDDREFSFVDATSFVTMKAARIGAALAFDGDFAAAGFSELRA